MSLELPAELVVGKIKWSNDRYSKVTPVKHLVDGNWEDAGSADYPPNGTVFWPASGSRPDSVLYVFTIRHADSVSPEREKYLVDQERPWYPIIDFSDRTWDEAVRQIHAGAVSAQDLAPEIDSVCLLCKSGEMVGPMRVRVEGEHVFFEDRNTQLHRVELRRNGRGVVDVEPGLRVYLPEGPAGTYVDCRTDRDVLRSALTDAAKLTRGSGGTVPELASTKRFINETIQLVPESSLSPEQIHRLEQARELVESQEMLAEAAEFLVDKVLDLPKVEAAIAGAAEAARQGAAAEVRRDAEERMADENSEIGMLVAQRKELEESFATRRIELQTELSKLESEVEVFESRILERLDDATVDAGELLADSVLLRLAKGTDRAVLSAAARVREPFPRAATPPTARGPEVLEQAAHVVGLPAIVLVRLHEILHAGLLPVLTGTGAMTALYAYAQVALGGRIAELPVAHDFLRPADLLGIRASDPEQHRLHGDLLASAGRECTPENPGLVVLEGFNCGSSDTYLLPWLSHPNREIKGPATVRSASSGTGARWGDGLLIAATAGIGMTTAPVSVEFWNYAAVIDVPAPARQHGEALAASTISPPVRVEASGDLVKLLHELVEVTSPVFEERIDLSRTLRDVAETQIVVGGDAALRRAQFAVDSVVVPALATAEISPPGLVDDVISDIAPIVRIETETLERAVARTRSVLR